MNTTGNTLAGTLREVLRAPVSGWAWRELAYLFSGLVVASVVSPIVYGLLLTSAGLLITFVGVPLLALTLAFCRGVGTLERWRARLLLRMAVEEPEPLRPAPGRGGPLAAMWATLRSGSAWRHTLYTVLHLPWAFCSALAGMLLWSVGWGLLTHPLWYWVFPRYTGQPGIQLGGEGYGDGRYVDTPLEIGVVALIGLALVLLTPWVVHALTWVDRLLVRGLLGPSPLASKVRRLEVDRGQVVDTASADLRRIERDLHDGAQARLVALAMDLGLAKEKLTEDPEAAARMVDEAHGEVKLALQELRDLARGIHPAILTDRGLGPALSALTPRCTVPVTIHTDLPTRPAPAIEAITYYTVSELLQNISKHSKATHATVELWHTPHRLMLQITDNGQGGATTTHGTGLAGLTERLGSVDGLLLIHSPTGGPTTITAELPWRDRHEDTPR
ncbi:sensor histidine kinase [Streptomyces alkaliterrae]|uniref:histidine kinase n=1 Tax=Streptomyces alkaliterrae TaxID=2213162 RepID=A0A5P0YRX4_9ACTN|nr:sensor histidine kinase [Streptomyces alkaliterrae]MBB1262122.1 sensor domain-containing protein [Streptomyces alkaliterrae]MQS03035.1 sensor histidine kinase [Streptomyces alkaliterrae]